MALFQASMDITIGTGVGVLFWEDAWIGGLMADSIVPSLLKMIRSAVRRKLTVAEGLLGNAWVRRITGELTVDATVSYLQMWSAIQDVPRLGDSQASR
jgi:hypothetical protein